MLSELTCCRFVPLILRASLPVLTLSANSDRVGKAQRVPKSERLALG